NERVKYGLKMPGGLSFLIKGSFSAEIPALDQIPATDRPPLNISFYSYHLMAGLGFLFVGLSSLGLFYWYRGTLYEKRWLLWIFVFAVLGPILSNQAGWVAAEMGRQPWIVYGLLRTSDALSKAVSASQVLGSIIMFMFIYLLLFAIWIYLLNSKIMHGPEPIAPSSDQEIN
ncbi:MAG: cytochrome ubiquinol oxidase subunit I, partial [SAR324 cluster bacterium]|nr:cytochrome ubiquinol oxidase subunit I [SAR324 cluster bacterium]